MPYIKTTHVQFGEAMDKKIEDKGRHWVRPSGTLPIYHYEKAKGGARTYICAPIGPCRELEFYKLKTEELRYSGKFCVVRN